MLTGAKPFNETGRETVFQKIREGRYRPLRSMQSQVPVHLEKIVNRCLKKNLDKRYPSVQELVFDLESFLGPEVSAHTDDNILRFLDGEALISPAMPVLEIRDKHKTKLVRNKKNWWLPALATIVIALILGASFVSYRLGVQSGFNSSVEMRERFGAPKPIKK